jgi:hypothetical protein
MNGNMNQNMYMCNNKMNYNTFNNNNQMMSNYPTNKNFNFYQGFEEQQKKSNFFN